MEFPLPRFFPGGDHRVKDCITGYFAALYREPWYPAADPGVERAKKRKAWRESEFAAELDRTLARRALNVVSHGWADRGEEQLYI